MKNLIDEFEEFERKEIGIGAHEKYHRLAEKLEIEAKDYQRRLKK